jgi:diguanylate cyclase (GGDEF)-like protein
MLPPATALPTQQLVEFLAVVSDVSDEPTATRVAAERAARALEAEVGVVLDGEVVVSAVGFPAGRTPAAELAEVARGERAVLDVPGAGPCHTAVAPIAGSGHLMVARSGGDGFTADEASLLRGMARVLELAVARLHTLAAERRRAAENVQLLTALQERHRLLEALSEVQRAIARQEPLPSILDAITGGARDLLGDDAATLDLRDEHGEHGEHSEHGERGGHGGHGEGGERERRGDRRAGGEDDGSDAGAARLAMSRDELVVLEERPPGARLRSAMAAPVHNNGVVVGGLVVGSFRARRYSARDRETLRVFADQVSLAVTDHRTREKAYEAHHDPLTGLASRALFLERLERGLAGAGTGRQRMAVLFIDLDRFKIVNDSLGHAAGDALLVAAADRLRSCLRLTDTAARIGGDEFAVALFDASADEAAKVARRMLGLLQDPFVVLGKEVFVSASIGICHATGGRTGEELIRAADLAMYAAKRNGKACYETFEPAMQDQLMRTLDLEADLRRAVECDEFVLRYQPVFDLVRGGVVAVEALVRWRHPDRGLVLPGQFVPLAEETGLIVAIGGRVLREACRQAGAWNAARPGRPPLTVQVNLSARQLQEPDLPDVVARALRDGGLDPGCLVLEITESLLLSDSEAMIARLRQLKRLGLRLALDDFGTGHSALAYLHRFPIDMIKIDRSFVAELASPLASAIVQFGRTLRLAVVAEGIETAEQLRRLRAAGCRLGQGYHFAGELQDSELASLLDRS